MQQNSGVSLYTKIPLENRVYK